MVLPHPSYRLDLTLFFVFFFLLNYIIKEAQSGRQFDKRHDAKMPFFQSINNTCILK